MFAMANKKHFHYYYKELSKIVLEVFISTYASTTCLYRFLT